MNEYKPSPVEIDRIREEFSPEGLSMTQMMGVLWKGKFLIIGVCAFFSVISVAIALYLPNIYRSEVILTPAKQDSAMGGLSGDLGGLASLAGVNLGGGADDKSQLALRVLTSRSFLSEFVIKHQILPNLMAVDEWNPIKNKLHYNPDIYDVTSNQWLREAKFPRKSEPSTQEAYDVLLDIISITTDKSSGLITLSVDHLSPFVSKQWADWLVEGINDEMRKRDLNEALKTIEYLKDKLKQTQIAEMQTILFQLIEEQTKTIMLAEVLDEYVFKTVDGAIVPELKNSPKRALICVLGTILGFIFSLFIVLFRFFIRGEDK